MTKTQKLYIRTGLMVLLFPPFLYLCALSLDYILIFARGGGDSVLGLVSGRFDPDYSSFFLAITCYAATLLIFWLMRDLRYMTGIFGPLFKDIREEVLEESGIEDTNSSGLIATLIKNTRRQFTKNSSTTVDETHSSDEPVDLEIEWEKAITKLFSRSFFIHVLVFVPLWYFSFSSTVSEPDRIHLVQILVTTTLLYLLSAAIFFLGRPVVKFWPNKYVETARDSFTLITIVAWFCAMFQLFIFELPPLP